MSNTWVAENKLGVLSSIKTLFDHNRLGDLLVLKGYISSDDLKNALSLQKIGNEPLGKILIETGQITRFQLLNLLFGQRILRVSAAVFLYGASLTAISKKSYAETIQDVPARIMLASLDSTFDDLREYPALFGASEKRSSNLKAFTKWSDMFKRFDADLNTEQGKKIAQNLKTQISSLKGSSVYETANAVNSFMNQKKYIVDNKNWGKSDYWATPIEFMARGGDCEDFAIAKYAALRALGVPENRMRILILQDQKKNVPHAVLTVYTEKGPMILDNQIKQMKSANSIHHYKPIFSINRTAWWLHTTPKEPTSTVIASAE
ncbi:MAG: transglutaminase-like cysteine peptidase [Alphaproteobacteria bacterium]